MTYSLFDRYGIAAGRFRKAVRPIVSFEFWFALIYAAALTPLSAFLLNRLIVSSGQIAFTNQELTTFFLSARGIVFTLLSMAFVIGFGYLELVGLLIISVKTIGRQKVSVSTVLWENMIRIPALIHLGLLQAVFYGAAVLPFAGGVVLTYYSLLGDRDINYYLSVQPWQWWLALAIAGTLAFLYLILAAWLLIRWLFAVPALVFENMQPVEAMKKSWHRTRHRFWKFMTPLVVWWLFILIVSFMFTWIFQAIVARLLVFAGTKLIFILPVVTIATVVGSIVNLLWFIAGKAVSALLIVDFYLESTPTELTPHDAIFGLKRISPSGLKLLGWTGVCAAMATAIVTGIAFLENIDLDRKIRVTAHRGSSLSAPENTMSAVRRAVADMADYAEIDVQTTEDGVVVLLHDADLMRVASVNKRIGDIQYEELSDIDIGSWFSSDFSNERVVSLEEVIAYAKGRIRLNIELKYNRPDPELAKKVGEIIRRKGFAGACVISSLDFNELHKAKQSFSEIKAGLIVFRSLGDLMETNVDFLSIHAAGATPKLVRDAHNNNKEIHVWTVNDVRTALSMVEIGVDNIITDDPEFMIGLLRSWNDLSDTEKIALWLRRLFLKDDEALVAEL
ncbi:glycerophosphodiester phosphodiesterase family protein [Thermodesulfobacteriota bacterium]